jgi:hypothetical protein
LEERKGKRKKVEAERKSSMKEHGRTRSQQMGAMRGYSFTRSQAQLQCSAKKIDRTLMRSSQTSNETRTNEEVVIGS